MAGLEAHGAPGAAWGRRGLLRRHWRLVALVVFLIGALVLSFGGLRYAFRSHPGPRSVESALDRFRSSTSTAPRSGFGHPAPGVYAAEGQGGEHISFPPNSQSDGAVMPVTVRDLPDGCWRWRIDYNTAHWHEFDFCPRGTELLLVGDRNFQSWDFGAVHVTNVGTFTCDPPSPVVVDDPRPGDSFPNDCTGVNTAVSGTTRVAGPAVVVGTEKLTIGGRGVAAVHQRRRQTMSGGQHGNSDEDWWFAADTGLPLRMERHYVVHSASPVGTVTYTENGSWQLRSLVPRT
jgi:hypothetical protein